MFLKWLFGESEGKALTASDDLRRLVAHSMPKADAATAAEVGALAGLMAVVAYADREYSEAERETVRDALVRVPNLDATALGAIEELLEEHIAELAHESLQTYTRVLYEQLERAGRLEVLELLMDLAAADEVLDMSETNILRRIANGLGLTELEYLASQERHRKRLSVLRGS